MEFAASCSPLRKSNASATTIRPIRIGKLMVRASTVKFRSSQVVGDERVDFVRDILESIHHTLKVIVDVSSNDIFHRVAVPIALAALQIQRLAALVMQLVRLLL